MMAPKPDLFIAHIFCIAGACAATSTSLWRSKTEVQKSGARFHGHDIGVPIEYKKVSYVKTQPVTAQLDATL